MKKNHKTICTSLLLKLVPCHVSTHAGAAAGAAAAAAGGGGAAAAAAVTAAAAAAVPLSPQLAW